MKKVLATVAVSTALVMGGAVAASAAGIEMEGSVRVRGLSEQKMQNNSTTWNVYDEQVRLGMKSNPSDNLTGYILLETGSATGDTYIWGQETASTLFKGGTNGGNTLSLIQAWMAYNPTKELTLKVGHMPIAPGTKQFINHDNSGDDAIVLAYDPNKNTHVHVATVKLAEVNNATTVLGSDNSADLDAYALVVTHKVNDAFKLGANYVYLNGAAQDDTAINSFNGMRLSNLGVDAAYKMGNLTLSGDVNLQFGTIKETLVAAETIDADGYAFQLGVDYKINNSNVGLLFAQGSGVDESATTTSDRFGNAFVNFLGDSAYQVYIPGYRKVTPGSFQSGILNSYSTNYGTSNSSTTNDGNQTGLSNLTLMQLNAKTATTCPLTGKKLNVRGALSYMKTTEDATPYNGATTKEDEIGTEIDIVAAWALTSNLTYQIEAAYLWTGDVYRTGAGTTGEPENAYFLRHGITMKF